MLVACGTSTDHLICAAHRMRSRLVYLHTVSLLVQLVGTHVPPHPPCIPFELRDVATVLQTVMGDVGFYGFGIGLFGAGISSAMTIPMGYVCPVPSSSMPLLALPCASASPLLAVWTILMGCACPVPSSSMPLLALSCASASPLLAVWTIPMGCACPVPSSSTVSLLL